jgi:glycosyltransferase involved in cell wall biosynthesis
MFKKCFRVVICIYIVMSIAIYFSPNILSKYYDGLKKSTTERGISVIVPIKNEEKRLIPLLESIKDQKYKNFEVVFVNDGSTDKSVEIIKQYSLEGVEIKIIDALISENVLTRYQYLLEQGVQASSKEILLFTNAGCSFDDYFLANLSCYYVDDTIGAAVISYRSTPKSNSFSSHMQILCEGYISNLCQTALAFNGFIGAKGQAISYLRKAYIDLNGQFAIPGHTNEDIFFTHKVYKSKYKVIGLPITIYKLQKESLLSVGMQHVRWIKGSFMSHLSAGFIITALQYVYHFSSIYLLFNPGINMILKIFGDYAFASSINRSLGYPLNAQEVIKTAMLYPFYYIAIFTASLLPGLPSIKIGWR